MKDKIIIILFVLGVIQPELFAQNSIHSLDDCIRLALDNNLTLKSGLISVERTKTLQGTAFNIDRTSISLSQDPTSGGSPDNSISLSQGFDFPTVYTARHRLLKAETNLEMKNLDLSKNELIKEVTNTYYQLIYARKFIEILSEQDSIYSKFLFLATVRFKSGESNQLEQINAERLYNENKIELFDAEKNYQNGQILMQTWLNTNQWIEPKESDMPLLNPLNSFDAQQSSFLQVYEGKLNVSEQNVKLQNQQFLPGFNISLRNQYVMKGFNPYNIDRERFDKGNFMGFEVGMSIPLFFGAQRAKMRAAKKEVEIARLEYDNTVLSVTREYETYLNKYARAQMALNYYKDSGYAKANEIRRISQISYEKGEINYIEYIQNLKAATEIKLQYANVVNEYNQIVIMLNYLQGNR